MDTWVWWLIGVAVVVVLVLVFPYFAQHTMDAGGGSGGGGNPFGVLQEIFHPAAHRAEASVVEQMRREQPTPQGEGDPDIPEDPDEPRRDNE